MVTFNASRYRPINETEDRILITVDVKFQGSYILPTHTLRMLGLISDREMVHQLNAQPASEPGQSVWTYDYLVKTVDSD